MSNTNNITPEHDDIVSMLPWYVNQTLDENKRKIVLKHLEQCCDCQSEVQFLSSANQTIRNDAIELYRDRSNVDRNLASVMNKIEALEDNNTARASLSSFLQSALNKIHTFTTSLPTAQWSATALAGVLVAVLGFQLLGSQSNNNDYTVLSSADAEVALKISVETVLPDDWQQIRAKIQGNFDKLGYTISFQTVSQNQHIVLLNDTVSVSDLSKVFGTLEQEDSISRVELVP